MAQSKEMTDYLKSLETMNGRELFEQFFKWHGTIARYEVAKMIDKKAAVVGKNRNEWIVEELTKIATFVNKSLELHEKHQAPLSRFLNK